MNILVTLLNEHTEKFEDNSDLIANFFNIQKLVIHNQLIENDLVVMSQHKY